MTFSVVAATKEERTKALHHEIAKEHFRRAVNLAPRGSKISHNALEGHFETHNAPHAHGISAHTIAGAKKKAFDHVADAGKKILAKHPAGKPGSDAKAAREHIKLGQHHANKAGLAGLGSFIPRQY